MQFPGTLSLVSVKNVNFILHFQFIEYIEKNIQNSIYKNNIINTNFGIFNLIFENVMFKV